MMLFLVVIALVLQLPGRPARHTAASTANGSHYAATLCAPDAYRSKHYLPLGSLLWLPLLSQYCAVFPKEPRLCSLTRFSLPLPIITQSPTLCTLSPFRHRFKVSYCKSSLFTIFTSPFCSVSYWKVTLGARNLNESELCLATLSFPRRLPPFLCPSSLRFHVSRLISSPNYRRLRLIVGLFYLFIFFILQEDSRLSRL